MPADDVLTALVNGIPQGIDAALKDLNNPLTALEDPIAADVDLIPGL